MLKKIKSNLSKALDENGLSKFLSEIRKFPILSSDEEMNLGEISWSDLKDPLPQFV